MATTMTKRKTSRGQAEVASAQMALNFEVFAIETPHGTVAVAGENPLDAAIRRTLVDVMDKANGKGLSRDRIADNMGELLARQITKAQLDQWAAPSQFDRRIPVDALLALMMVCDDYSPLDWMAHHVGRRVLTADEALCAEFGAMAVLDRHIKAKQKAIEGQMDEKLVGQLMHRIKRITK
ncbi:hypothetical protein DN523_29110 [Burkholderia multivorans]|uniref:hypothetical protein n=2 Tax=Burkholderia multivorans TaxID=87883 RepID=UPI000DABA445|nr:hypothetical protein [Burkholderia multivorans]RAA31176.1 hypothetical protein DN471_06400 [Burkholderia multivorans]RAA38204.1 hypothetical protein DN472_26830 [Burkholderia multivorans]RAA41803.1 hypothetical protein DN500_18520 [Burkholderia multivorans]RAA54137.1 hypothetical protein DN507_24790 [Burkholderia multivorans]RAA57831.1 hypothetical protein DN530_00755 [Burkholderia multivorans]